MKTPTALLVCMLCVNGVYSQVNEWTWMKGDSTRNGYSPSSQIGKIAWTGLNGDLWMFGGTSRDDVNTYYNSELWKYNVSSNQWLQINNPGWTGNIKYGIKGVGSPTNHPGARTAVAGWVDPSNNLWLFGGEGSVFNPVTGFDDYRVYSDVWKFNVNTGYWTWMGGDTLSNTPAHYGTTDVYASLNTPGVRRSSMSWSDDFGNFYLLGGTIYDTNFIGYNMNDMWEYNTSLNQWRCRNGDTIRNEKGIYGTMGIPTSATKPGARSGACIWKRSGKVWMYGGGGYANSSFGALNDLWCWSGSYWTWIGGDSIPEKPPVYGSLGIASSFNTPGGRGVSYYWQDGNNNFWLWGGSSNNSHNQATDLWNYNTVTKEWTWVSGDSVRNNWGLYGVQGVSSPNNKPCSRSWGICWTDHDYNFWLHGGVGYDTTFWGPGYMNDLWRYVPATTLPLHLLTFTAKPQNNNVQLNWTSENEQSFARYEVERSSDGRAFERIQNVKCKMKNGKNAYECIDPVNRQLSSVNTLYYRLKMVDKDGSYTYSKTEKVSFSILHFAFSIFPNPATTQVQLQFAKPITGKVEIEVSDVSGKVVLKRSLSGAPRSLSGAEGSGAEGSNLTISTTNLATGSYVVKVVCGGEEYVQKMIVNK